ncbi:MAG TPA: hypothetical protein VI121_01940 [Agromyces sp.]
MTRLLDEQDELRAAVDHLFATRRFDDIAELAWPMYSFWWGGGRAGEIRTWMSRLLEPGVELTERSRMIAEYCVNAIRYWRSSDVSGRPAMERCASYFRQQGDRRGEALALAALAVSQFTQEPPDIDGAEQSSRRSLELADEFDSAFAGAMVGLMVGRVQLAQGRIGDAVRQFETSLAQARRIDDTLGQAVSLSHLGWARVLDGETERARACFGEELLLASTIGHEEGIADAFEGMFATAATSGDIDRAGRMLGAAEDIRARKGLPARSPLSFFEPHLERVLAGPDARRFEEARAIGRQTDLADVVELALA